jgi:hypothetical protein
MSSSLVYSWVRFAQSLVICVDHCLSFFLWPLYCQTFHTISNQITGRMKNPEIEGRQNKDKKTNNDLQNDTQKTKDGAKRA